MGTTTIKSFRFSPSGFTTACPRRQVPHTCGLTSVCPEVFLGPTIPRMQLASLSAIPREIYDGVIKDYPNPHLILNHSPNQSSTSTLPCLFIAPPHRHQLAPPWTMRRIWLTRVASGQLLPYAIPKLTSAGYKLVAGMSLHVPPPPRGSGRISVRVRRRTRYLGRYLDLLISSSGGRGGPWTMKGSDNHDPPFANTLLGHGH